MQPRSACLNQPGNRRGLVDAEIVHDDVVALVEFRTGHLADVSGKDLHVGGAFDQERGIDAVVAQGRDKG